MFTHNAMHNRITGRGARLRACAILTVLIIFATAHAARAQSDIRLDPNTSGSLYLLAFPDTVGNTLDSRYPNTRVRDELTLWMFSDDSSTVQIQYDSHLESIRLEPRKFTTYTLKRSTARVNQIDKFSAIIVIAMHPIVLYCYLATTQGLEAWAPAPLNTWGRSYRVASIPGEVVRDIGIAGELEIPTTPHPGPAEIVIIAAHDSTHVTITPPPGTGFAGNPPLDVIMGYGDVYQLQSRVDTTAGAKGQEDIAGTKIEANRTIGVISGNARAQNYTDTSFRGMGIIGNAYKNMLMEWLPPIETYGTQFLYLPTNDAENPHGADTVHRKAEYVRVYNPAGSDIHGTYGNPGGADSTFTVLPNTFTELRFTDGRPRAITTNRHAQVMMHSSAIVDLYGTTPCFRGFECIVYLAWAPYMAEMIPREHWTTFAPYYTPTNPGSMRHRIVVVTDSASAANVVTEKGTPFTSTIPGTGLVWGDHAVDSAGTHWIAGRSGARFAAMAYGTMQGDEDYRPGAARRKDGPTVTGGGADAPRSQHPLEYEEYNALSYGYPLAPGRSVVAPPDQLSIQTSIDCNGMTITVHALGNNPVGLSRITLDYPPINSRIDPVDPARDSDIFGSTSATVRVSPVDSAMPSRADVLISDRTGNVTRIPFAVPGSGLGIAPPKGLDIGRVGVGSTSSGTVTVTNVITNTIHITDMHLRHGAAGNFKLVPPTLPLTLAPGASRDIVINYGPDLIGGFSRDTLDLEIDTVCYPHRTYPIQALGVAGVAAPALTNAGMAIRTDGGRWLAVTLKVPTHVRAELFDALGKRVRTLADESMEAGEHLLPLDDAGLASGTYYCTMTTPEGSRSVSWVVIR